MTIRVMLPVPHSVAFYKTGGMAAALDCGGVIVAEDNKDGMVVGDIP